MSAFTLETLARTVAERAKGADSASYTASLVARGPAHCARKFGEEAIEAVIAGATGDASALRGEAADVLYHLLVLLEVSGVPYGDVVAELERRTAQSGLQEKEGRAR